MGATSHPQVLDALISELQSARTQNFGRALVREKAGLSPSTPSTPYYHGPGGLFGVSGLERDIISTRVHPMGLASELPARGTVVTNPLFPYITGYSAGTGVNPNGVCDDAPEAGPLQTCVQTAQFGRYSYQTRTLDIARNGQQINRGEFLDLRVVNDPLLEGTGSITTPNMNGSPSLTREVLARFVEVGVSFQNKLVPQLWTGNPANNTAGGGYQEFPGLDILIGTNKIDALSGTACPALDSDVKDFNYGVLGASAGGNTNIVNTIVYLMRYLNWNADRMNMSPVDFSLVMRPELWYELTAVWPCAYFTYRCQTLSSSVSNDTLVIDQADQIKLRDDMRNGMFLLVDGVRYDVILDMGIHEDSNTTNSHVTSGCFASNIYVVPRTFRNGLAATYWEYLDFSQTAMLALADGGGAAAWDFWTDGGRFLWHRKPPANRCIQWQAWIEPRLILLTPHLAGKVLNVGYCPLQHTRGAFPTDPYFSSNAGVGGRPGPSLYSDWNPKPN